MREKWSLAFLAAPLVTGKSCGCKADETCCQDDTGYACCIDQTPLALAICAQRHHAAPRT
jgi:hypothetical protein